MTNVEGKVAVVVGASSEGGTGWAIAALLAERGAKVVVAARREEPLKALARQTGGTAVVCDVGKEQDIINLSRVALATYGKVDIAINAAGSPIPCKIAEATEGMLLNLCKTNYFGNVFFVKHMTEAIGSDGAIVLFSSVSVQLTVEPHGLYACAKAATDCLVRYAALEYGPRRIRVNSILPGALVSDMTKDYFAIPGVHQAHLKESPIRRLTYPEDYAEATLWLATSPAMTGSNLVIAGGNHLTRFPYQSELFSSDGRQASEVFAP